MSDFRDRCLAGALALSCVIVAHGADRPPANPATKSPAPGLDFLEYLGTLESDEENWTDVVNVDLPTETNPPKQMALSQSKSIPGKAKSIGATTAKGNSKPEAAAKSAGSEK